jgi:hypothetical protein
MRHKGNNNLEAEERNRTLLKLYRRKISKCRFIKCEAIFRAIASSPSPRFWVSEYRAAIVLSRMFNGDKLEGMRKNNRDMYFEIFRRAQEIRKTKPLADFLSLATTIVYQPAPSFYLTPFSVCTIITKYRKALRTRACQENH